MSMSGFLSWFKHLDGLALFAFICGMMFLKARNEVRTLGIIMIISFILVRILAEISGPLFSEYRNSHISGINRATSISLISMFGCFYLMFARLIIGKLANVNLSYAFIFMGMVIIGASLFLRIDEAHVSRSPSHNKLKLR